MLDSWLWELEPQHFRVAFEVVALAADEAHLVRRPLLGEILVPVGGICTTLDRLAERSRSTVKVVRTALAKLAAGGLATVESSPRGYTLIVLSDPSMFGIGRAQQGHSDAQRNDSGNGHRIGDTGTAKGTGGAQQRAQEGHSKGHSPGTGSVAPIPGVMGAAAALVAASGTARTAEFSVDSKDLHVVIVDDGHSEGQGVGSVGDNNPSESGPDRALTRASEISDSEIPDPDLETQEERESEGEETDDDPSPALLSRADRIPLRAWRAADYLRAMILADQPTNALAHKRWEQGAGGAAIRVRLVDGDGKALDELGAIGLRTGARLAWADDFRKLHELDKRDWDEIARTVAWLFRGQAGEADFVVQSPKSLRAKWDRIQIARKRAPRTNGPRQGITQVRREPEKW